ASTRVNVRIFYQPLTAPTGLGLLTSAPRRRVSVGQHAARSLPERWPAVLPRGDVSFAVQGHRRALDWAARSLPLSNLERDWTPRGATLFLLAGLSLFCAGVAWISGNLFWVASFRARCSRRSGHSREALGLTWTKTISCSSAPQPPAHPASGAKTTTTCCVK